MPSLFERLRDALAPEYQLERELGGGGMGVVFLARETALERPVAVKIVRPELATALATERFVREARVLARLAHPNVVSVHRAGEAGGLFYYIMDYIAGPTLAQRLEGGPLSPREAVRVGEDLLKALAAVHRLGVVHRDIKPSNVFLTPERALLADFGIARSSDASVDGLSIPGAPVGTPGYMPPEQIAAAGIGPQTDLYAVGIVLYEAVTGRKWLLPSHESRADWSGIPRPLAAVLRRALAWLSASRWPDAASFQRALTRVRVRPYIQRTIALTAAGVGIGAAAVALAGGPWRRASDLDASGRSVRIAPFTAEGREGSGTLGDSLAQLVAADLGGIPDFVIVGPRDLRQHAPAELGGVVRPEAGAWCVSATLRRLSGGRASTLPTTCAAADRLLDLADSLARLTLVEIWTGEEPYVTGLPRGALPRTPQGVGAWIRAEQLFGQGRWVEAYWAYRDAEQADSTCWICSWRLFWVENWRDLPHDSVRVRRFLAHLGTLPPEYRSVMRASALPIAGRLDTLLVAAHQFPHFFFAWWFLGEEQFHRGPLLGHWRREAMESFVRATELAPSFAPVWEHLAWLRTAEGDSTGAQSALDEWGRAMGGAPHDTFSLQLRGLITAGFAWRFSHPAYAEEVARQSLLLPEINASPDLSAGPRLMPTLDAYQGSVWLGKVFAAKRDRPHLAKSGLLAEALGYAALGRPDSARARLRDLVMAFPEPELEGFAAEYAGALIQVDSVGVAHWRKDTERELARLSAPQRGPRELRERAAWMRWLLSGNGAARFGDAGLNAFTESWDLARRGRWAEAIAHSDPLIETPTREFDAVTLRALVRFSRADWFARLANPDAARRELRWAEHYHVNRYPSGPPQTADVDWSLRTLARWRLATILDQAGERGEEVCDAYLRVADAWSEGEAIYRARADSARGRGATLGCTRRR
jgi:hypothetical protein